jgi:hypothetical protein
MKIRFLFFLSAFVLCTGCVSMTPKGAKIMLHSQISSQLDSCTKLGPVISEASAFKQMTWAAVEQQAKNNLRDAAARQYGDRVDTVALINLDSYNTKVVANGIAFKCF